MKPNYWIWIYLSLFGLFSVYSYSQVDPNLILSSHPWLLSLQRQLWEFGYHQRFLSSITYAGLIACLFLVYGMVLKQLKKRGNVDQFSTKWIALCVLVLALSYPALSHDIFNYMFNAKMVWVYGADPHRSVALDFPTDPWLMFTHNTHTVAPYYYGWTLLSLIPSVMGQSHVKITILLFRIFMIIWMWIWLKGIVRLGGNKFWVAALALNPLVLIETVSTIHNDVVMMACLVWSLVWFKKGLNGTKRWWILSALVFGVSVSIKYASVMAIAGWVLWKGLRKSKIRWSLGSSLIVTHFLPLLTRRSQWFLPWYLLWPLTFMPLGNLTLLNETLLLFTMTGLLSYVPFLFLGEYTQTLLLVRSMILFAPPLSYLFTQILLKYIRNKG